MYRYIHNDASFRLLLYLASLILLIKVSSGDEKLIFLSLLFFYRPARSRSPSPAPAAEERGRSRSRSRE
jgi:hypothetical protein